MKIIYKETLIIIKNLYTFLPDNSNKSKSTSSLKETTETSQRLSLATSLTDIKFDNKAYTLEVDTEQIDKALYQEPTEDTKKKELDVSSNENQEASSGACSFPENTIVDATEGTEQIEEIVEPSKKEIQIYGK